MDYIKELKKSNLKVTPQRLQLIKYIDEVGHIDVDSLYKLLKSNFSSISLATLYKNINTMIDKNILKEVKINGQKSKFEIIKAAHAHTVCINCGEMKDLFLSMDKINKIAKNKSNFHILESSLNYFGTCEKCD